jgi:hypothetical protein
LERRGCRGDLGDSRRATTNSWPAPTGSRSTRSPRTATGVRCSGWMPRMGRLSRPRSTRTCSSPPRVPLPTSNPPAALVAIRPSDGAVLAAASGPGANGVNIATYGQAAPRLDLQDRVVPGVAASRDHARRQPGVLADHRRRRQDVRQLFGLSERFPGADSPAYGPRAVVQHRLPQCPRIAGQVRPRSSRRLPSASASTTTSVPRRTSARFPRLRARPRRLPT